MGVICGRVGGVIGRYGRIYRVKVLSNTSILCVGGIRTTRAMRLISRVKAHLPTVCSTLKGTVVYRCDSRRVQRLCPSNFIPVASCDIAALRRLHRRLRSTEMGNCTFSGERVGRRAMYCTITLGRQGGALTTVDVSVPMFHTAGRGVTSIAHVLLGTHSHVRRRLGALRSVGVNVSSRRWKCFPFRTQCMGVVKLAGCPLGK